MKEFNHIKAYSRIARPLFPFYFVVVEKGSGDLTIEFPCDEIDRFCRALIAGDELKRGAKDLCGYVSYCTCHLCNSLLITD